MADQLSLSYWLRGYSAGNMHRHFEKLLRAFPFSRLSQGQSVLRVHAISFQEPPLAERGLDDPLPPDDLLALVREHTAPDCGFLLESRWDLWTQEGDWALRPVRCNLACFGPEFESVEGEHLRLEFGLETQFLPNPDEPVGLPMVRSNVQSLLTLVHRLDDALAVERRRLWTESGENFAERLQAALQGS